MLHPQKYKNPDPPRNLLFHDILLAQQTVTRVDPVQNRSPQDPWLSAREEQQTLYEQDRKALVGMAQSDIAHPSSVRMNLVVGAEAS